MVGELIKHLEDRTSTGETFNIMIGMRGRGGSVRRCDIACYLIERLTLCRFHFRESTGSLYSEEPLESRKIIAARIMEWWKEYRAKPWPEGVMAQIPKAPYYSRIWMAENLVLEGAGVDPKYRESGLEALREMVRVRNGGRCNQVVEALARYGDMGWREIVCNRFKWTLENNALMWHSLPGRQLLDHGERREWELLTRVAQTFIQRGFIKGDSDARYILNFMVRSRKARSSPWAVPGIVLAIRHPKYPRTRAEALALLQKNTGIDFGYTSDISKDAIGPVVERVLDWWEKEGKAKYEFDRIEERLKATSPK